MGEQVARRRTYYTFQAFLSEDERTKFFNWTHAQQVTKVAQYLDFLGQQPDAAAQFVTSKKASVSFAILRQDRQRRIRETLASGNLVDFSVQSYDQGEALDPVLLTCLVEGKTLSGFGATGTDEGFLPQKQLSLAVANSIDAIGHQYIVERNKRGDVLAPVLNSRSFFFYWSHAEKQKLVDIRQKLDQESRHRIDRRAYWEQLVVVVDRVMCLDCIEFATRLALAERASLCVEDPEALRIFPSSEDQQIEIIPLGTITQS